MTGKKIDVIEVERLDIVEDSRGIIFRNDATNFVIQSGSPWTGISGGVAGGTTKQFFPAASSMGWLKIHYVSGSTYGATGATAYIPLFRNLDTNTA